MAARSSSTRSPRAELEKRVAETIVAEWGPKGIEKAKAGLIKSPFLAGDGKEARNKQSGELHPGMGPDVFFIRPSANKDRPPAVWWKDPNKQEDETTVYSGCYGKAILNCFAWHNDKSGDGVSFGIRASRSTRKASGSAALGRSTRRNGPRLSTTKARRPPRPQAARAPAACSATDSRRRVAACREGGRARENLPAGAAATIERSP